MACSICDETFGNSINHLQCPRILPCGHTFCLECIVGISQNSKRCPICNVEFDPRNTIINYDMFNQEAEEKPASEEILDLFRPHPHPQLHHHHPQPHHHPILQILEEELQEQPQQQPQPHLQQLLQELQHQDPQLNYYMHNHKQTPYIYYYK